MSERPRSVWRKLGSWLRGRSPGALDGRSGTRLGAAAVRGQLPGRLPLRGGLHSEPVHLRPEEELWLSALATEVGAGRRTDEIGSSEFWQRIDAMWQRGHERLAIEWLEKLIDAPATPEAAVVALRARLVELCDRRGDLALAVPHLEELVFHEQHAVRAHYLLGEHCRRQGDEVRALRHYEAVLARDMGYPNVRARVERLRQMRGQSQAVAMGETIAGADSLGVASGSRYVLMRELGRGATGVVYLARDAELERDVAVKLLHPHLAATTRAEACARFFEEARISASLRHPNILAVLDLDERARRIVLELAAGGTLRAVLRERGPRPLRRALERHTQILSALAATHRRGIVHRDLKPGNLLFRRDPDEPGAEIVLGDFGVAHLPGIGAGPAAGADGAAGAAASNKPTEAVGTLAYMAPEQRRGDSTDPRMDLYAAAVVLYEMLTCRYPWPREVLLAGARARGDFRLPAEVTGNASARLVQRLQQHLDSLGDPDPAARPETQAALAEARALLDLVLVE